MAEKIDTPDVDAKAQEWEAAQYEDALAHLERLQEQLDNLRSTIPSLVSPLVTSSRAQMFADVKKAAMQSSSDLKTFREDWQGDRTQDLLARAKASREKDGDLSKAVEVERWGWSTR